MKYLALFLFLTGCASTPEELNNKAMACMRSLVQDEDGSMRTRNAEELDRDCGKLFEARNKRAERDLIREQGPPKCPDGFISVCQGGSCGRLPRRESDLRDYSCMNMRDFKRMIYGNF